MVRALIATFLSFVFFYQLAQAASVTITSPKPNDILKMGKAVEIKWEIADGVSVDKISIALASGPAQALMIDRVIVANVDAKNGTYKWTIPKTLTPKSKYVIEVGPNSSDIAFAGYISIVKPANSTNSTGSARPSSSLHPSAGVHPSGSVRPSGSVHPSGRVHPSASIPGPKKPSASAPLSSEKPKPTASPSRPASSVKPSSHHHSSSAAHESHKNKDTKTSTSTTTTTTSSTSSSTAPANPSAVRVMCRAFPDEHDQMTTSCREVPLPTETVKPKQHGTLRRRDKFATIKRSA